MTEMQFFQEFFGSMMVFMIVILIAAAIEIAGRVLFAVGVYKDAQGNYNNNAMMWALLIGFLGLIPAIIYFCVRKPAMPPLQCPHCRGQLQGAFPTCPYCKGTIDLTIPPQENPSFIELRAKGKKLMIWGGILVIVSTVLAIVGTIIYMAAAFNTVSRIPSSGWEFSYGDDSPFGDNYGGFPRFDSAFSYIQSKFFLKA